MDNYIYSNVVNITNYNQEEFEIVAGKLIKYKGQTSNVIIPDGVSIIGEKAFYKCSNLIQVTMPNSVTKIEEKAFYQCYKLREISLDNIEAIGPFAFSECNGLKKICLPACLKSIGNWAFSMCNELEDVVIDNGVTNVSYGMFNNCKKLKNVSLPNTVTLIDGCAFRDCKNLRKIIIPQNITKICDEAFYGCSSLKEIIHPSHIKFGSFIGTPYAQPYVWKHSGKCEFCGGDFYGLFKKKCFDCKKPKSY